MVQGSSSCSHAADDVLLGVARDQSAAVAAEVLLVPAEGFGPDCDTTGDARPREQRSVEVAAGKDLREVRLRLCVPQIDVDSDLAELCRRELEDARAIGCARSRDETETQPLSGALVDSVGPSTTARLFEQAARLRDVVTVLTPVRPVEGLGREKHGTVHRSPDRRRRVALDLAGYRDAIDAERQRLAHEFRLERGVTARTDPEHEVLHSVPGQAAVRQPGSLRISRASSEDRCPHHRG